MIVEQIMQKDVFTLLPSNTLNDAYFLMNEMNIRHIPIVDEHKKLCGIITSHDVNNALPSSLIKKTSTSLYETPIEKFMTKDVVVGHPLDFVEDVATTFYHSKFSCLPIVSKEELVGIVTTTDLLNAYIKLTGALHPSSKINIQVTNQPGVIADIMQVLKQNNAYMLSMLMYPDPSEESKQILCIRIKGINPLPLIKQLQQEGFSVLWPYVPGVEI